MTEPVDLSAYLGSGDESVEAPAGYEPSNPAWKEFVGDAPQEVYQKYLEPAYTKWDQHVNKRFDEHNQTYGPWKDFVKSSDPETASFAVRLLDAMHNNPVDVLPRLQEYYSQNGHEFKAPGAPGQGQTEPKVEEDPYAGQITQMQQQMQLMRDALLAQQRDRADQDAESWLDSEISRLQDSNKLRGPFNERWVLALAANTGGDQAALEKAVEEYYTMADSIASTARPKPMILSNGGGAPSGQQPNPRTMDNKQTNSLIVDILNATNAARNQ